MGSLKTVLARLGITLGIFMGVYLVTYSVFNVLGLAKEPKMMEEYKAAYTELKELQSKVSVLSEENNEELIESNKNKIEELKEEISSLEQEIKNIKE